jgi:hypothetical protein
MASDWGVFLFLTTLPLFMKEVLQFDISTVYYVLKLKLKSNKNNKIMLCLKNKERTTLSVALFFLLAFSS